MRPATILKPLELSGKGLHTGLESHLIFKPASENSGIVIHKIPAKIEKVSGSKRGTNLGDIYTVEHLLGALYGLGIDDLEIEISGPEVPALDGSARPYVELLKDSIVEQKKGEKKGFIEVKEPLSVESGERVILALPYSGFKITYVVDFPETPVGCQLASFEINKDNFIKEIAPARTFGFFKEIGSLFAENLARGGTLKNAIVIGENGYSTKLRFKNEFVRHKILDLMGDISLIGRPLKAHLIALKAGHGLHLKLAELIVGKEKKKCQKKK